MISHRDTHISGVAVPTHLQSNTRPWEDVSLICLRQPGRYQHATAAKNGEHFTFVVGAYSVKAYEERATG